MSTENNSNIKPEKVYVERVDSSNTGWAVAVMVLVMAIGFGFLFYSNQQASNQMKLEQAYENLKEESLTANTPDESKVSIQVPEIKVPEVKLPDVDIPDVEIRTGNGGTSEQSGAGTTSTDIQS